MNPHTTQKNLESILSAYTNQKIYKFVHLPVQSGDNNILKKMKRKYTVKDFLEIVKKFRERFPDITLSTDIIVGFPTETDKQFCNSVNLLKTINPDIVNITRYSARPFTKAKQMQGRIPTELVKNRSKILSELCATISEKKNKKYLGKKIAILITEKGKNNTYMGRAYNYKTAVVREKVHIGEFVSVEIVDSASNYLFGKLI
jgi:MiaB/RimO family radical SAM methylthiotransferase